MIEVKNHDKVRVLEYRKQVKLAAVYLKYFTFVFFLLFLGGLGIYLLDQHKNVPPNGLLSAVIKIGIAWLLLYLVYLYLIKPLATSKIKVFEDHLEIRRGKKEIIVQFNDIIQVKTAVNKNIGGWFKLVLKNGKAYRFTIVLERVDYIIDAIHAFNPKLMDKNKHSNLRTNLLLADHSQARLYSFFEKKYRWITAMHLLILPLGFAVFLYFKQGQLMLIKNLWPFYFDTLFVMYIPIFIIASIALTASDFLINKPIKIRLLQNPANKLRDILFEHSIYRKIFPVYILCLLCVFSFIYLFNINNKSFTQTSVDVPHLGIYRSELVWVDKRFNCIECFFSLKRGDGILFYNHGDDYLGKLDGLPGEFTRINSVDSNGRYIASAEEIKIPAGKIAVRINPDGSAVTLVDIQNIRGRISKSQFILPF